jgi:NAD(P)-dependent dehydrogenase (short-subunit alcohol dehydrogenase family)
MQHEITEMLKQGKGTIVNCSSVAGLVGFEGLPAYVAQAWRNRINKTAALEYAEQGIRVNAVCPGVIQTPMMDRLTKKKKEAIEQFTALEPVGRMGQPEEIASVWMCSDEASL